MKVIDVVRIEWLIETYENTIQFYAENTPTHNNDPRFFDGLIRETETVIKDLKETIKSENLIDLDARLKELLPFAHPIREEANSFFEAYDYGFEAGVKTAFDIAGKTDKQMENWRLGHRMPEGKENLNG